MNAFIIIMKSVLKTACPEAATQVAASIFLEVIAIYIYPDDLAGKATLWLWTLRDVVILGAGALFSALALARTSLSFPAVLTALYAFLTIRLEDVSILDFCRRAAAFLLLVPQRYEWRDHRDP